MDLVPLHTCLLSEWPRVLDPCHIFNKEKPSKAYWKVVFFAVAVLGNELKAPRMSGKLTTTGAEFIPTPESCVLNVSIALCLPRLRYLRFVQAILFLFHFFLGCSRATSGSADPFLPPCHPSEPPWSSPAGAGGRCHLCFSLCFHSKTCSFCSNLVLLFSADFGLSATWFVSFLLPRKKSEKRWQRKAMQERAVMTQETVIAFLSRGTKWDSVKRAELDFIYTCS